MANTTRIQVVGRKDGPLIDTVKAVIDEVKFTPSDIAVSLFSDFQIKVPPSWDSPQLREALEFDSTLIREVRLEFSSAIFQVIRQTKQDNSGYELGSGIDVVCISPRGGNRSQSVAQDEMIRLIESARRRFEPVDQRAFLAGLPDEVKSFYQAQQQEIGTLKQEQVKFFEQGRSFVAELTKLHREREDELARRTAEREQQLDARFAEKEKQLQQRVEEFEAKKREFDDSEHKLARRQQFTTFLAKLTSETEQLLATSAKTARMRWPVLIALALLVLISGGGAVAYHLFNAQHGADAGWVAISSQYGLSVLFVFSVFYFIRWNNQWAHQHADEEFRLKRLRLDLNRAQYIAELAMEWEKTGGGGMPAVLVERLSNGLFTDSTAPPRDDSPAEALASALFGSAAQVKVKTPEGTEVMLDRKSIKELNQSK